MWDVPSTAGLGWFLSWKIAIRKKIKSLFYTIITYFWLFYVLTKSTLIDLNTTHLHKNVKCNERHVSNLSIIRSPKNNVFTAQIENIIKYDSVQYTKNVEKVDALNLQIFRESTKHKDLFQLESNYELWDTIFAEDNK